MKEFKVLFDNSFLNSSNIEYLVKYFENYRLNLTNNTLNSYIKGVIKH